MPQTAVEVGLRDPFDPMQAIPASAKFLRKLFDQFGNLGLAAAAYNAGGGRIEKWLSRKSTLPKETRDYVVIITGHKAEAWTDEENTIAMPTDLPARRWCEGVGGLSKTDQIAETPVSLTPSAGAMVRKAEADEAEDKKNEAAKKLRLAASQIDRTAAAARKINGRTVVLASRYAARKAGKRANVRFASTAGGRAKNRGQRETVAPRFSPQVAGDPVAVRALLERRRLAAAQRQLRDRAAGVEMAAGRRIDRARHLALRAGCAGASPWDRGSAPPTAAPRCRDAAARHRARAPARSRRCGRDTSRRRGRLMCSTTDRSWAMNR